MRKIPNSNRAKLNKLSDICADIAQIALASVIAPFLIDKFNPLMLLLGTGMAFVFWGASLILAR